MNNTRTSTPDIGSGQLAPAGAKRRTIKDLLTEVEGATNDLFTMSLSIANTLESTETEAADVASSPRPDNVESRLIELLANLNEVLHQLVRSHSILGA